MVKNIQFTKISFKTAAVSFISNLLVKQKEKKKTSYIHFLRIVTLPSDPILCVLMKHMCSNKYFNSMTVLLKEKFSTKISLQSFALITPLNFSSCCLEIRICIYYFINICQKYIYIPFHIINPFASEIQCIYTFLEKSSKRGQHHAYYIECITRSLLSTLNMKISSIISYLFPMPYEQKSVPMNSEQKRPKTSELKE